MKTTRTRAKAMLPGIVLAAAVTMLAAGCADMSSTTTTTTTTASAPTPHVWDCGLVSASTPSKYVCGGKVYTSYQLAKLREEETKKYESGK